MNREYDEDDQWKVKGKQREKKLNKKRNTMRVNSRGLKDVILPLLEKKAKQKTDFRMERVTGRVIKTYSFN